MLSRVHCFAIVREKSQIESQFTDKWLVGVYQEHKIIEIAEFLN